MKAILEFNLPEEQEEFETAKNGILYKIILDELDNWLRSKIKYSEEDITIYTECRDRLHQLTKDQFE